MVDEALIQRFEGLRTVVTAHRQEAEQRARLSTPVVEALIDAGVARLYLPESLGGLEVDPLTCARITETLATMDSAAGWFVMVSNAAKLMAAHWPDTLAEEIFGSKPDVVVAASGNRPFIAQPEGEGYRIDGVNSFVSGCHHADWLMSPMLVGGVPHMGLLPMAQCEIVDNWDSLGMRGTGSNDVQAQGLRIPARHLLPARQQVPGRDQISSPNRFYGGALYRAPSRIVFATYVPVTLVLAEQALSELSDLAQGKTPYAEDRKLKHRSLAQIKYGRALATFRAARGLFFDALEVAWERALAGDAASPDQRADLYLAGTHAVQSAAHVVRWVADAAGTSVIYQHTPLSRIVRDMETLRHHGFASESRYGSVAQQLWGAELDYQLLLR